LGSKPSRSPGTKFRFGFSGSVKRKKEDRATVDDILDSLSRRAELSDRFDEAARIAFEDEAERSSVSPGVSDSVRQEARKRALGKFAFVILMVAGVFAIWLYGALSAVLDGTAVGRLTRSPVYFSAFTDPVKLAILVMCCFIPVIWLRKRTRAKRPSAIRLSSLVDCARNIVFSRFVLAHCARPGSCERNLRHVLARRL
jgi:hypothetical protein